MSHTTLSTFAVAVTDADPTSIQDFPHTKNVPHYALMARNDLVVGPWLAADAGELGHGASPLDDPGVIRLETGFVEDRRPESGTIEDTNTTADDPFESHSSVYTKGSTSFNNIVGVITGTTVETYAPNVTLPGPRAESVSGIEADSYTPRRLDTAAESALAAHIDAQEE
ncbi:hypothetical protein ACQEVI_06575 [Promicromonospora sp. CA-289599]|uniref:hypothetical protein n=1 Tax=Promicromonospora sp. CA-289599 TaxID=3240014 RepID=UPI003D909CCF